MQKSKNSNNHVTVTFILLSIRLVSQGDCCMAVSFLKCNDIIIRERNTNTIKQNILRDIIEYNFYLYAWHMQKLQTEYIKPTLKESRNPPLLQLNVACYEWDILRQEIWLHKVIIHDQRSLNKIYQKSNERLGHNHVGHQYSYRNTQCFLLHYGKKN